MVLLDPPRKRRNRHTRFLVITAVILTLSVGTAHAATKKVATTSKTKKVTVAAVATKKTTTKVKGEKISANKISVIGDNTISTYKVKAGDTLSSIAKKFDISINTIRWSNNINSKATIHIGETLTILPTSGIIYTVKAGDTISGIAVKFSADQNDILNANDLLDADSLKIGIKLTIPNTEPLTSDASASVVHDTTTVPENISPITTPAIPDTNTQSAAVPGTTIMVTNPVTEITYPIVATQPSVVASYTISPENIRGYYAQPISGRLSQGIHDVNAVDIAAPIGTTVHVAAAGMVIVANGNRKYNGGYGNYIVVSHQNGTQTLYAHLSEVTVALGEEVVQGQPIALSGNTGRTTGAHLHFEIRGAVNPWGSDALGTMYSI